MASDLPLVRLGDYVDACLGKMLDAQKNRGKLQPYLGNSNVRWGAFDLEDLAVMRFEEHEDERYGIRDGDLIVCEGGEPGRCAIWRGDTPMKIQKALHRVRTKNGLDNHFLYYWFLQAGRTGELEPFFTGTTIKHLTGRALAELRIPLLPIESQREVAKVLRSLDAKIDLNHRINQTLEAMAQAIFQSWFVDFDPVKAKIAAKADGRDPQRAAMGAISGKADSELDALPPEQYKQLAATAELFPDEMEASELGEIPRGWGISTVGQVAEVIKGKSYSSKDLIDNTQTALVTLKSFERGGGFRMDGFKPYVGAFKPTQVVEPGELIVAYTDVTQAAELIGRPAIVVGVDKYQTLVASLDVGIVRPHLDQVSRQFLFGLFSTDAFQAHTFAHTSGTTVLHLAKEGVPSFRFAKPPTDLINNFSNYADPVVAMKQSALDQVAALTQLRDALLPKLLSGELQVQQAETEAVA